MKRFALVVVLALTGCAQTYVREVPVYSNYEPVYYIHRTEYYSPYYYRPKPYYVNPFFGGFLFGLGTGYIFWH